MEKIRESHPNAESDERKLRLASEILEAATSMSFAMLCTDAAADWAEDAIWEADIEAFANCWDACLRSPDADWMRASRENGGIDDRSDREDESDDVESEYDWSASDTEFMAP